ncbi:MAG: MBL fold metallo-hydrolase [Candidatus Cloacimonadaceae bacterium]|nr:MBL fold metallo-hydrolase [Candidatus Cloacimonadaceae bacterium]MDP3114521.1 MBL fold metallo-hydrolase [Candidatus Cloacimonadaceae bacterium]
MFQTSVLVSGSKGNSVLVRTENSALLLDAGVSAKKLFAAMETLGVSRHEIKAIIVSHEHSDHTRSAGALSRLLKVPIYLNEETHEYCAHKLGSLSVPTCFFETGESFYVGDIVVHPFSSSHDAADSCNFTFSKDDCSDLKLGVAMDLGFPTQLCIAKLKNCSSLVLESNHDERMLMEGPYDWPLKQRIKSTRGHLSNIQAVGVVSQVLHYELKHIILAHLSEINNDPALAYETMQNYLTSVRSDAKLFVASQYQNTPLFSI